MNKTIGGLAQRLRDDAKRVREGRVRYMSHESQDTAADIIEQQQAEIERLRAALCQCDLDNKYVELWSDSERGSDGY